MAVDARVKYTKMIIEKSFIELLKVKQLNKITVKEICDLADINRSTFYKHYEDVFDLFDKMKSELRNDFLGLIRQIKGYDKKKTLVAALEKIKKNKDIYIALLTESSGNNLLNETVDDYFREMMKEKEREFADVEEENRIWLLHYLAWGSSGILHCWVNNDMKESAEYVADMIDKFVDNTLKMKL